MYIKKSTVFVIAAAFVLSLFITIGVLAGTNTPDSGPTGASSQMYTLDEIYDRLTGQGNVTKMDEFTEPGSAPGSTMHTLDEIYDLAWPSRPAKTGQTTSYATGDDGDLEKGVDWPSTRFTDNSDGTVTDNLTGLIWLKNANCFGMKKWEDAGPTYPAIAAANTLNSGECSLTDGSNEGDWRLPHVRELHSLIDYGESFPALPSGHPFTNVQLTYYWSGTTHAYNTSGAWFVLLNVGFVNIASKTSSYYVWPVRGGQ